MLLIDPRRFLSDPDVQPFMRDFRIDLTAADAPIRAAGEFIIADLPVTDKQVLLIKTLVPHVYTRTDVGAATETFRPLTGQEANGHFLWQPVVNDQSPLLGVDYNAARLAGSAQNTDRFNLNGFSHISESPFMDAQKTWDNPLFTFMVDSNRRFRVIWSILPVGAVSPIPYPYAVGGGAGTRRVDFAGVVVAGVVMSKQKYEGVVQDIRNQAPPSAPIITPGNP